jgi:hypothetical protein
MRCERRMNRKCHSRSVCDTFSARSAGSTGLFSVLITRAVSFDHLVGPQSLWQATKHEYNTSPVGSAQTNAPEVFSVEPEDFPAAKHTCESSVDRESKCPISSRQWDSFLALHPTGFYADLARAQRAKIGLPAQPAAPSKKLTAIPPRPIIPDKKSPSEQVGPKRVKLAPPMDEPEKKRLPAVGGGDQMSCCIRYKIRVGISQANAVGACKTHVSMQRNYPAQAGVSNWCKL